MKEWIMHTNKSVMELEREKCKGVPTAREKAEAILAQMNGMLRDRPLFQVSDDKRFDRLNESLHGLGWLGLIKTLKRRSDGYYAQLKLVDPASEEAKRVRFFSRH